MTEIALKDLDGLYKPAGKLVLAKSLPKVDKTQL
jgi:hypothetical protein